MTQLNSELSSWRESGGFVTVEPFSRQVFYCQFGETSAVPDDTLLLLHGFPESSFSYHKVIDGLQPRFKRIIAFDMLGYGFSDKPEGYSYSLIPQADVALQVWQQLGVTGGHVLSHDMGTSVLTEVVTRHVQTQLPAWFSDGLQSVTFTNGSMVLHLAKLRLMQKLLLSGVGPIVSRRARYSLFRKTIISAHGVAIDAAIDVALDEPHALSERDIQNLWQNCTQQDGHLKNHLIIRYLNDRKRFETTRWLPALGAAATTLKTHICWGTADQVARVSMAHYLKESVCPDAQMTLMPGAGHFCQLGSPELWVETVLNQYKQS